MSWSALPLEDLAERQTNLGLTFNPSQDAFHIALETSKALLFLDDARLRDAVSVIRLRTNSLTLLAAAISSRPRQSESLRTYSEAILKYIEGLRVAFGHYVVREQFDLPADPGQPDYDAAS